MENFKIEIPYNKKDFIRLNMVRLKIQRIKMNKQLKGFAIAAIIVFGLGILARTDNEPDNPFMFIGFLLLLVTIWMLVFMVFSKRQFSVKINEIANQYDKVKMDCIYEFTDDSVKYWDKEKHLDFKWCVFSSYSIYKDFLIITLNNSLIHSYIFEKKESDIDNYTKILELVKTKLEFKEIK